MSAAEARIYAAIIERQIALQEMEAALFHAENDPVERDLLALTQKIEHQREALSRLWERARAAKAARENCDCLP